MARLIRDLSTSKDGRISVWITGALGATMTDLFQPMVK